MGVRKLSSAAVAVAGAAGISLALAACGGSSGGGTTPDSNASGGGDSGIDCAAYKAFGDLSGKTVSIYTGIVAPEDATNINAYKAFEDCTGVKVNYEGDKSFEAQVLVRTKAGNPPDLAIVPQPGLLAQLVATGKVKPAPKETEANVDKWWPEIWKKYGTVDGTFYAAPYGANVKSFVWYSPQEFKDNGYEIPTTLDELKALSDKIAGTGKKPWCAGIASGEATGWPITDWMEDWMLRTAGPDVYDQWVDHTIPFNSEAPTTALNDVGEYLKNDKYVNGGLGGIDSIATTTFQDAGLPILDGNCSLHRQASFYAANWGEGVTIAEDGDVFAFYLPGKTADEKPLLGGGEFIAAFADRPEVKAFQTYLASDTLANERAKAAASGGVVSANKGLKVDNLKSVIDQLSVKLLQDPKAEFRFDGSDLMPGAVGSNSFWKQATAWITGQSTKDTLDKIEASWPKS